MYEVFRLRTFEKEMQKSLSPDEQRFLAHIERKLSAGAFGKPLGPRCLREIRIRGKRIYLIVYEDVRMILLVAVSGKKAQQETIDGIRALLPAYRECVLTRRAGFFLP